MRRLTAFIIITLMLVTSILPIGANEVYHSQGVEQNTGDTDVGTSPLEHGVSEEFIVTIPEKVDMVLNTTVSADVSVSDVHLPRAKNLVIKVSGQHYHDGASAGWKLQHETNTGIYLNYKVAQTADASSATIGNYTTILTHNVGENTAGGAGTKLYFNVISEPILGGQYLDNLIFTVCIEDKT